LAGICLYELINPFVMLSFGENYLFGRIIVLVLCVNFVVMGLRSPSTIFHDSLGLFYYDRYKALGEAVVNLLASIALARFFGPIGVFCGTLLATLVTSSWIEPWVIYRKSLGTSPLRYYVRLLAYILVIASAWALTSWTCSFISGAPLTTMLLRFPICLAVPTAVFCLVFWRTAEFQLLWSKAAQLMRNRFGKQEEEE
jgi:O-antigen/teichoic acid export membrane protein